MGLLFEPVKMNQAFLDNCGHVLARLVVHLCFQEDPVVDETHRFEAKGYPLRTIKVAIVEVDDMVK